MNTKAVILGIFVLSFLIVGGFFFFSFSIVKPSVKSANTTSPQEARREIVQYPINPNNTPGVSAGKLPEFSFDIAGAKFKNILNSTKDKLKDIVEAGIVHETYAAMKLNVELEADVRNKKLIVKPDDIANFKPGLYKLSLRMRTLEGIVDIEQDFAWGVIAVNTNKSIYSPGEEAKIGIGVLNDAGETQCLYGFNHVTKLSMVVTDPNGKFEKFDIEDKSIKDSGKCGAITVTNEADFQSIYKTGGEGVYQVSVTAVVKGNERRIVDYFKVESSPDFDVERTSFPTRIYPPAPYPNTFKVTSRNNYSGNVVDIVPASFSIEHISDNGRLERDGDFYRIIWSVELKAGVAKEFTYFIKFPMVSPEFYLIGPIKIGNFVEARQWQIASDAINSTSGLVSYEDNNSSNTWSRIWTGTDWSPAIGTNATSMDTSPADSRWFREVSSPKTGEKIVALKDNVGSTDPYFVFTWNGSAWNQDLTFNSNSSENTRTFDVAYEELSGDAIFVYSDNTNQLKYYKRVNGVWDGSASNAGTGLDSRKKWVKAKAQFDSDTIVIGTLNDNERVGAMIWDGSTNTFGSQFEDDDSPAQTEAVTSDEEAMDIAIETQSGTPMIFWGTAANNVKYMEYTGGAWGAETNLYTGFTQDVEWITAAADPRSSSNYIAFAMQDSDSDTTSETMNCSFGMWTGSATETLVQTPTCRSDFLGRLNNVAFEHNSGRAVFVYITSANPAQMTWRTWTAGNSSPGSGTTETGSTGNIESIQLYSDLNTTSMVALYVDAAGNLWDREWDGTSWSAKRSLSVHTIGGANKTIQNTGEDAEAYGFGFDRNLEQQVAYRWFDNSGTVAVSNALTSQDTPYTLTSANQQFRLRLLLYTTDTITTSQRNYKLQYVDPGTGTCDSPTGGTPSTWTDVPTSGGQISFYNNGTPADGDNLTANGSLDPTYRGKTKVSQDYEEANNFTNTVASIPADQLGLWDFSLVDNTNYDRIAQTFCFRVARSSDVVLQIGVYPQISTAAIEDVILQGGTNINQGTAINNP